MEHNIIEITNLHKSFDHTEMVKGIDLQVRPGEFLTLLGPSGCGKTTTLRMIAGFEDADCDSITIDGQDVTALPPYKREVNTVFQSYALFPLMNVYDNVAYGLTVKRLPKAEIREKVTQALKTVQLEGFEKRKISQMSGGQKQLGITFIYVTHDQEEAMTMSDRIAVMRAGEIEQIDTPSAIYNTPATRFVADFIGESNLLEATADSAPVDGVCSYSTPAGRVLAQGTGTAGQKVYLCVRPEAVSASAQPVDGFDIPVTVTDNICTGNMIKTIAADRAGHELRFSRLVGSEGFPCGQKLYLHWDAAACTVMEK